MNKTGINTALVIIIAVLLIVVIAFWKQNSVSKKEIAQSSTEEKVEVIQEQLKEIGEVDIVTISPKEELKLLQNQLNLLLELQKQLE